MNGKLTTHVLDTAHGCPAASISLQLWSVDVESGRKTLLKTIVTNVDGRTDAPLLIDAELTVGLYELVFEVGEYFARFSDALNDPPFLDRIPLQFGIADPTAHYHVPLLVSPGRTAPIGEAEMSYSIAELNQMSQGEFVAVLGEIFEETPVIAHQAWKKRPFADTADLHQQMVDVVQAMNKEEQLALIRVHPELGSKVKMAEASVQEQSGIGLDRLTSAEYERFGVLNSMYKKKFGFPFIVAVRNHTKDSILTAFEGRLENTVDQEIEQAIAEIFKIAQLRLSAMVM